MIIVRRKYFADPNQDPNQQQGMSTAAKVGIGLGTVGTLAAGFYGAKKGVFGNKMMARTNNLYARAGQFVGSNRMVQSGTHGVATAYAKELHGDNWANMSKMQQNRAIVGGLQDMGLSHRGITANSDLSKMKDMTAAITATPGAQATTPPPVAS